MLQEINNEEFNQYLESKGDLCLLAYTSMCGTCEQAKVMLNIISETLKDVNICKINVNFHPSIIKEYDITSIPCFLLFKDGIVIDKFYAFHSVTFLFNKVRQIIS